MHQLENIQDDIVNVLRKNGMVRTGQLIALVNQHRQHKHTLAQSEGIAKYERAKASVGVVVKNLVLLQEQGKVKKTVSKDSQAVYYRLSDDYESLILTDVLKYLIKTPYRTLCKQLAEPKRLEDPNVILDITKAAFKGVSTEQLFDTILLLRVCSSMITIYLQKTS